MTCLLENSKILISEPKLANPETEFKGTVLLGGKTQHRLYFLKTLRRASHPEKLFVNFTDAKQIAY